MPTNFEMENQAISKKIADNLEKINDKITLRDLYAGFALCGFLSNGKNNLQDVVNDSFIFADCMLQGRTKLLGVKDINEILEKTSVKKEVQK